MKVFQDNYSVFFSYSPSSSKCRRSKNGSKLRSLSLFELRNKAIQQINFERLKWRQIFGLNFDEKLMLSLFKWHLNLSPRGKVNAVCSQMYKNVIFDTIKDKLGFGK